MQATEVTSSELQHLCETMAAQAKSASYQLLDLPTAKKNEWLVRSAERLESQLDRILEANARDLELGASFGLDAAAMDRLKLTPARIKDIANGLRDIAKLPDPCGECIDSWDRPNGLRVQRVRVPIGVIFFIYESRPNVTADAAAIALKSGNAIILRGGKESRNSSRAIVEAMQSVANEVGIPKYAMQFVDTPDRDAVGYFLKMVSQIDLVIPRGGESLVRRVTEEARMPVLKHFDGNCHVYVDEQADLDKAVRIVVNAKCQRMGVCNAMESLVVHRRIAQEFLPRLNEALKPFEIEIRGDASVCSVLENAVLAEESDWGKEYLGPILSACVVESTDQAIEHINRYSSKHTDAIITESKETASRFTQRVDSAAVIVNASTRFNDGGQLGLGAEIGISTDKLHARGPCGLRELTTYKYVIHGDGQIRE